MAGVDAKNSEISPRGKLIARTLEFGAECAPSAKLGRDRGVGAPSSGQVAYGRFLDRVRNSQHTTVG